MGRHAKAVGALAGSLLVAACSSVPPSTPEPVPERAAMAPVTRTSPHPAFEQRQRDRALGFVRQGRLADAALAWEVLAMLRPDVTDYGDRLADVRRQIAAAVAERLPLAAQAARRGEVDRATQLYLGVLAVDRDNAQAADALRAIERERLKRNHLGKYARNTLTRRAIIEAEMAPAPRLDERNGIEHAAMLAGQGDWDDAISLLERRLRANPREEASKRLLAEIYLQKVQAQPGLDKGTAIRSLERSVQLDPANAGARARLRQLKPADAGPRPAPTGGTAPPAGAASAPTR